MRETGGAQGHAHIFVLENTVSLLLELPHASEAEGKQDAAGVMYTSFLHRRLSES